MNKKILIATLLILGAIIGGIAWYSSGSSEKKGAIKKAKEYKPKGICLTVMTPAVHKITGAEYEFSSSCLPEDWEPKKR